MSYAYLFKYIIIGDTGEFFEIFHCTHPLKKKSIFSSHWNSSLSHSIWKKKKSLLLIRHILRHSKLKEFLCLV